MPVNFVKICGITRIEDARAAVAAGADALGFVFWPDSPRYVDPEQARAIIAALPASTMSVGVFVDQPAEHVNAIAVRAGLRCVQLHGTEHLSYVQTMATPVLKAISVPAGQTVDIDQWPPSVTVLLDVHDPIRKGGTGRTVDWNVAAALAARRRVVLAGGLTPDNVADAVACVRPWGIDVSSGVETTPGIKDHERLRALFEAVHGSHHAARS